MNARDAADVLLRVRRDWTTYSDEYKALALALASLRAAGEPVAWRCASFDLGGRVNETRYVTSRAEMLILQDKGFRCVELPEAAAPPSDAPSGGKEYGARRTAYGASTPIEPTPSPAEQGAREETRTMPWRREWHGSTDRGWHIVEAVRPSHNKRIAFLGECTEAAVDAIIDAHNATAVRSPDCVWGCPANTVCDYCQRPVRSAQWLEDAAEVQQRRCLCCGYVDERRI